MNSTSEATVGNIASQYLVIFYNIIGGTICYHSIEIALLIKTTGEHRYSTNRYNTDRL